MRRIVKNDHGSIKLVLLALVMLTPFSARAEYYDIAIQYGTEESNFHSVLVTGNPNDVGGNPTNILGDGTMSYDQDKNVLTLNGVNLTCSYGSADFISHNGYWDSEQVVTVHLVGSNTVTLGNNSYFFEGKQITFTAADNNASLTIVTQDGREIGIFSDRATPTYNSHLFLEKISENEENEYYIQTLTCQIGSFTDNNNNIVVRFGDDTGCTDEKTHYSIDYVDENLQDVTNAEWVYNDDDVTLLGPCTMTYYKTAGGGQSETMTAKLFGLATNSVTTTLGTPVAPPTIVPAFDHSEDLIITEIENPASGVAPVYNGTTGLISTSAVGETTCSVKLGNSTANGYDYLVLNENDDKQKHIFGDFTLTVSEGYVFGGTGTEASPYIISTSTQLKAFATMFNNNELADNCYVKLGADIDCTGLEGFQPIGTPQKPFIGTFNGSKGDNTGYYKISNLSYDAVGESDYAGLFCVIGSDNNPGSVSNLILENCTFQKGTESNGAIAGMLSNGSIENCTVTSCGILSEASWPSCGGIVGSLYGGSITNCTVNGSTITATSVTNSQAGGIVGFITGTATVSECQVTGTTVTGSVNSQGETGNNYSGGIVGVCSDSEITISNNKVLGNTTISSTDMHSTNTCAGAIVGDKGPASLAGNTYEYTVTTSTKNGEDAAVTRDGYTTRGTGVNQDESADVENFDVTSNNGAVLYTKKLTISGLGEHCAFEGIESYEPLSDYDNKIFYLATDQTAIVYLYPDDNYVPSVSLSYTESGATNPTTKTINKGPEAEEYVYSFNMPDAETTFNVTLTAKPSIWIGDVEVRGDGTFPDYDEDVASFNSQTNTLTLNGISYSGEITSGLDALTIKVTGTNNQIGKIVSLNPAATLTFEKASAEAAASLTLSTAQMAKASAVISGFANVNWGDMYLSSSTPYQYDTTNKLLVNPIDEDNEITQATITSGTAYPLWVGGTQVTGSAVTGDNIRRNGVYDGDDYGITFTAGETNLLQLKRVGIHIAESHKPAIVSGLDNLIIQLEDRNQINFNGDYACYMVASAKENATLTFKASGDDALLTANIGDSQYIGSPANGFKTVSYEGDLVYIAYGTSTQYIKKLDAPTVSLSDGYLMLSSNDSNEGNIESLVIKYSVDYADASLTDVTDATYDEEESRAISSPCTITAHAEYNGKTSIEATAKYFGFTEPMQVVYAGTAVELPALPALVPAIADGDDVTYQIGSEPEGTAVSYDEQTEKYMVQGVGTAVLEINLMQGDNTPYNVLNEVAQLTINVIPTAPTIELAEGEHLSSETVSITSTITGAVIKYKWNDGTTQTYTEAIPVENGTLTAWVEVNPEGTTIVSSEEVTAVYTVKTDIATLYVAPIEDITYTGSAVTPTIVVKATEEAEVSLVSGTDYTVSYKQGETAVAAAALINVATYTVVISGNGSYGGTKEVTFKIIKATPNITFAQESYSATLGESFTSPATVDNWTVSPTASSNTSVANISEGQIVLVGVGTTMITVTYAGNDNYNSTTASYELVVSRALDIAFAGTNSWASYYATENLAVPEGLTAYVVSAVNEETGAVTVASVDYLPANNAVLLKREQNGDASGYTATAYTDDPEPIENNLLAGSVNTTDISTLGNTPVYVLFNDQFKRATSGTIPARRAYLPLGAAVAPAHARQSMNINISDGSVTAIKTLTVDDTNDSWYTIDGLKLNGKPQRKGLYINKGKKVYINSNK